MENYKNESMIDVAYSILSNEIKTVIDFYDLFDLVAERLELTQEEREDRISNFYTCLSLDGRIIHLGDNKWDLRTNHKIDEIKDEESEIYTDLDDEEKGNLDVEELSKEEKAEIGLEDDEDNSEEDSSEE